MQPARSNVIHISNVYNVQDSPRNDKEFQQHVRGKDNLKTMLKVLSGNGWIDGSVNLRPYVYLLNEQQKTEWHNDYCARLGDREEKVYGQIQIDQKLKTIIRCYKTDCSQFRNCCPDYKPGDPLPYSPSAPITQREYENDSIAINIPTVLDQEQIGQNTMVIDLINEEPVTVVRPIESSYSSNSQLISAETVAHNQSTIINSHPRERILVIAGPGTGKTYSLIEKLKYMIDYQQTVDANSVLVLCFTRAAVREIKQRFSIDLDLGDYSDNLSRVDIRTFDSYASRCLLEKGMDIKNTDYDRRIEMAIELIKSNPDLLADKKHLIVDEIQDLVGVRARFVQTLLSYLPEECGFTLLGDPFQGIFDFQIKDHPGELTSVDLLDWLRSKFEEELVEVVLTDNHRQSGYLQELSSYSRHYLESNNPEVIGQFLARIGEMGPGLIDINAALMDAGSVAILCRSNGEVIDISRTLNDRHIDHSVRKTPQTSPLTPVWIGDILSTNKPYLTLKEFGEMTACGMSWPEDTTKSVFVDLQAMTGEHGRVLKMEQLKRGLASGEILPEDLYENAHNICITTIHQSKGREFDIVFLLPPWENNDLDVLEEGKVYYVAITRAKKRLSIFDTGKNGTWIKRLRKVDRWSEQGWRANGGTRILRFEVGMDKDIDENSFVRNTDVSSAERQKYIRNVVKIGDSIELRKENDSIYAIYHKENHIGNMSDLFNKQVGEIWTNHPPDRFEDVYINAIYSVVKKPETVPLGIAEPYFSTGVWFGVSLLGLGRARWNNFGEG